MAVTGGRSIVKNGVLVTFVLLVSACNEISGSTGNNQPIETATERAERERLESETSILDLFSDRDDPNTTIEVNKYLWAASLEVLNFLPIQSADPFSGLIVTGFGTPPGGRQAYRATVLVNDPALEARSLNVALATRSGPVASETVRAVEDAILSRARELRIRDLNL